MIKQFFNKENLFIFFILIFFLFIRIPGIHIPYHQDEYKWINYSHPELIAPGAVPHPPLTEFIYTRFGPLVGDNNFRSIPFIFGLANLFLIFYLSKIIFDKRVAFWTAFLFTISFFSLLASLMVDVDGAVMPFFFLLLLIGYYKWKEKKFEFNSKNWAWITLAVIGAIGGFLIKVITALPIAALALDYTLERKMFSDRRKFIKILFFGILGVGILAAVLILSKYIFPFFNLSYALKYWEHFANFGKRNWFQTFIQFAKAILYSSPLLLLPLIFITKEIYKKTRPLIIFLVLELVVYLFVFDFSQGALDRYLQFLIVPLCIIVGAIYSKHFTEQGKISNLWKIFIAIIVVLIFKLQFLNQFVPSLYPKSAWVSRVLSLKWNFLYVFSGGSGPFPFYVSFLFMAFIWLACLIFAIWALFKSNYRKLFILAIFVLGVLYNGVFAEEYLFGKINGSAQKMLSEAVQFIKNDPNIQHVTVYNDNGGYEIQKIGKYRKRLYTDPAFDVNVKMATLNQYKEHYLELNIPRIDPTSVYRKYLDSCKIIYKETDKYIGAYVYDCRLAPDVKK